jgi:hypothetical protein
MSRLCRGGQAVWLGWSLGVNEVPVKNALYVRPNALE